MRNHLVWAFVLLISAAGAVSAQVTEQWVARYNGPANGNDFARAIALDAKGNVYVTGWSDGEGTGTDFLTLKYDPDGNLLWAARYNGPDNGDDQAIGIALDAAGNVYVSGQSWGGDTNFDFATIKYDPDGNERWVARYDGPASGADGATAIAVDQDGNVYVTGTAATFTSGNDYATVKYDTDGNELWVTLYNGTGNGDDEAAAIAVDRCGNVVVTGGSLGAGTGTDWATIKYDPDGNQLWVARYDLDRRTDEATAVVVDAEGNVYVTGSVRNRGYMRYGTIKYDRDGNVLWGDSHGIGRSNAIAIDDQTNVYVTGLITIGPYNHYGTIKYDPFGRQSWVAILDNYSSEAHALALDTQGNVYVTGTARRIRGDRPDYDYATVKYGPDGRQLWVALYNGTGSSDDSANAVAVDGDGNVYVTGRSVGIRSNFDFVTIKYSQK